MVKFLFRLIAQLLGLLLVLFLDTALVDAFDHPVFFGEAALSLIGITVVTFIYFNISTMYLWRWLSNSNN